MVGESRRAVPADEREVAFALLVIGSGERDAVSPEPFCTRNAMSAVPVGVPVRRGPAPEPMQRLEHIRKRQVVRMKLHQDDDVDVVKKQRSTSATLS